MNGLEAAILEGAKAAQHEYTDMTGWWLSHGPESFLAHSVVRKVHAIGFSVFPEASPKKILRERGEHPRGRPRKDLGQRFDIVVWFKTGNSVRSVIEVKRAWGIGDLRGDRKKVGDYMALNSHVQSGYLLAYTEAKGHCRSGDLSDSEKAERRDRLLKNRMARWAGELGCSLAGSHVDARGDGTWGWAIGLFRIK